MNLSDLYAGVDVVRDISALDDKHRVCASSQLRISCANAKGIKPDGDRWRYYRDIAEVPNHAQYLTIRQAFIVYTAAAMWRGGYRATTLEMDRLKVRASANAVLRNGLDLTLPLRFWGSEGILGRDLPKALEPCIGRTVDYSTVFRWGQRVKVKVAKNKRLPADQVNAILNHALAS